MSEILNKFKGRVVKCDGEKVLKFGTYQLSGWPELQWCYIGEEVDVTLLREGNTFSFDIERTGYINLPKEDEETDMENSDALGFCRDFNRISVWELELILEWLDDRDYLSDDGIDFRKEFWELFIHNPSSDDEEPV